MVEELVARHQAHPPAASVERGRGGKSIERALNARGGQTQLLRQRAHGPIACRVSQQPKQNHYVHFPYTDHHRIMSRYMVQGLVTAHWYSIFLDRCCIPNVLAFRPVRLPL